MSGYSAADAIAADAFRYLPGKMLAPGSSAYAAAMRASAFGSTRGTPTEKAMFDCPEHSQTSPKMTSESVMTAPVERVAVRLPVVKAGCGGSETRHLPSAWMVAVAVAFNVVFSNAIFTVAPTGPQPQMDAASGARCRSMWSAYAWANRKGSTAGANALTVVARQS